MKNEIEIISHIESINYQEIGNTKKQILLHLKKNGNTSLEDLAKHFSLSKMGILKHIQQLDEQNVIKRINVKSKTGRGRPTLFIGLEEKSTDMFPKAYSSLSCYALQYIEKKLGVHGIKEVLQSRATELENDYKNKFINKSLEEKVKVLTDIRNTEGYIAEYTKNIQSFFLDEYNCPIFQVAQEYGQACVSERQLFENLLGVPVETTHRVVAGDNVCRFVIQRNI